MQMTVEIENPYTWPNFPFLIIWHEISDSYGVIHARAIDIVTPQIYKLPEGFEGVALILEELPVEYFRTVDQILEAGWVPAMIWD